MAPTDPPGKPVFWFGRHKGEALESVPSSYLRWALRTVKLSARLCCAVADELRRRNVEAPAVLPPPARRCHRCQSTELRKVWHQFRDGRRQIHATCGHCGAGCACLPLTPENVAEADANASPTALLDLLTEAEALGVTVTKRGGYLSLEPYQRVTPRLRELERQAGHLAARMVIG